MTNTRLKRRSLELKPLEKWLSSGRGGYHWEHSRWLPKVVRLGLTIAGLRRRAEANALRHILTEVVFRFPDLPPLFDGYTVLFLSDLHIDGTIGLAEAAANQLRDLEVDLCVLGGDYRFDVQGPCHNVYSGMGKVLDAVRSRDGVIGILGNHDFAEEADELERMGVKMLLNQSLEIRREPESLWFVGLDDPHYYGCDDIPAAIAEVPAGSFKILVVHSPEMIPEAEEAGFRLYLCGHTHGGQLCLPKIGPILVHAKCPRRYTRGPWEYKGVRGFTSVGVGCSALPARLNCPPEVVKLVLKRSV